MTYVDNDPKVRPYREVFRRGTGAAQRRDQTTRSALLLNSAGGVLIVLAFLAICGWSILAAEDELAETAELATARWARAAVVDSEALHHLMGTSDDITPADRTYLETIARTADVVAFTIYGADGDAVFAFSRDDSVALPQRRSMDEPVAARTEIVRDGQAPALPAVMARVSLPLSSLGAGAGWITALTDQSAAAELYRGEMHVTLAITSILAALALGNCLGVYFLLRRKQTSDQEIFQLAHHDSLTGLANRKQFLDTLAECFPMERASDSTVALHFLDLDGFKAVNDTLGHKAGDKLLQAVADQLLQCARHDDVVARLGGDEFALLQRDAITVGDAEALAGRLVESVRAIRRSDGSLVGVTLSVGTALAPIHAATADDLTKFADIALYRAKEEGRDRHVTFAPGMEEEVNARQLMRLAVRRAVETESFELYYQPIYRAADGAIAGFEALARLPDGSGGGILPSEFIPFAESMGLMPRLGAWVIKRACMAAAAWPRPVPVAINLSVQQFTEDVVSTVTEAIAASGLPPERLELEITESLLMANEAAVIAQLNALKALGVKIVMDDFGTGYSSLSYLWKFPFDKLKVDRSFFGSLDASESVREVLRTISAMGDAMHLTLVAEGIETEDQRSFARQAGYDELQGYLCGRPMPEEDVLRQFGS